MIVAALTAVVVLVMMFILNLQSTLSQNDECPYDDYALCAFWSEFNAKNRHGSTR